MSRGHIRLTQIRSKPEQVDYEVLTDEYSADGSESVIGELHLIPSQNRYVFSAKGKFEQEDHFSPSFFALPAIERSRLEKLDYRGKTFRPIMRKVHVAATALLDSKRFPIAFEA